MTSEHERFLREEMTTISRREIPVLGPYIPPRTETERKLAAIWRDGLDIDQIGIRDDYNDLGRDSLVAASIFVEIEEMFGLAIPMAALVDAPTIEQLGRQIDELLAKGKK